MLSATTSALILSIGFCIISGINYAIVKLSYPLLTPSNTRKLVMNNTMGTVFVVLGLLKIFNLTSFSAIFRKYDIVSKMIPSYSYIYPFIEIVLGIGFLTQVKVNLLHIFTLLLMGISIISVVLTLIAGESLRCGCLGSFFYIPLSYVTLAENVTMLGMSAALLTQNALQ